LPRTGSARCAGPTCYADAGATLLAKDKTAKDFVSDAFARCKFIGCNAAAVPFIEKVGVSQTEFDDGMVALDPTGAAGFLKAADRLRVWPREFKFGLDADAFLAP
jgi:catalase